MSLINPDTCISDKCDDFAQLSDEIKGLESSCRKCMRSIGQLRVEANEVCTKIELHLSNIRERHRSVTLIETVKTGFIRLCSWI